MIRAGTRPPDRAELARARAARAREGQQVEASEGAAEELPSGPPHVGHQRSWNQPREGTLDVFIDGTPGSASSPTEGAVEDAEPPKLQ